MLFAESSGGFGFIIFLAIMALGARQCCKVLKGNDALRSGAKKAGLNILSRLFKK